MPEHKKGGGRNFDFRSRRSLPVLLHLSKQNVINFRIFFFFLNSILSVWIIVSVARGHRTHPPPPPPHHPSITKRTKSRAPRGFLMLWLTRDGKVHFQHVSFLLANIGRGRHFRARDNRIRLRCVCCLFVVAPDSPDGFGGERNVLLSIRAHRCYEHDRRVWEI